MARMTARRMKGRKNESYLASLKNIRPGKGTKLMERVIPSSALPPFTESFDWGTACAGWRGAMRVVPECPSRELDVDPAGSAGTR